MRLVSGHRPEWERGGYWAAKLSGLTCPYGIFVIVVTSHYHPGTFRTLPHHTIYRLLRNEFRFPAWLELRKP